MIAMVRQILCASALSALAAAPSWAQDAMTEEAPADEAGTAEGDGAEVAEEDEPPTRPGAEEGEFPIHDDLAECAAMLAVGASTSTSFVERDSFLNAAGDWFAVSGDIAIAEGALPEPSSWDEKVAQWSGRIPSVGALYAQTDWVAYCQHVGAQRGLDTGMFTSYWEQPYTAPPAATR